MSTPTESLGVAVPIAESAERTATATFGPFANPNGAASLVLVAKSTAATSTPSVTFKIQGYDPVTQGTWDIITSSAVTDGSTTRVVKVNAGFTAATNVAQDIVPAYFQVVATHADADPITYSVGASLSG